MIPLAQACDFKGSRGDGVHIWKETERAEIRAELDAAYFHLYGIEREDAEYMLSTFTNTGLIPEATRSQQFSGAPEVRVRWFLSSSIGSSVLDRRAKQLLSTLSGRRRSRCTPPFRPGPRHTASQRLPQLTNAPRPTTSISKRPAHGGKF